jgi:ABC-type multidrug transport system fused ATPase/permease subunit
MKSSPIYSPFTALALKVIGLIMIVSSLLDYIFLAIPFNVGQRAWQLAYVGQVVDRGILPMVGIAFLLLGYWAESSAGSSERTSLVQDLRFWALLLSSLLGLAFLLIIPLHVNNVAQQSDAELKQIDQRAKQAQVQIEGRAQQIAASVKDPNGLAQLKKQLADIDQALETGRVPAEQQPQVKAYRQLLQTMTQNPSQAISQELEAAKAKIAKDKQALEEQTKTSAWRSALRTSLSSLLLAIGYITIGWSGLRSGR